MAGAFIAKRWPAPPNLQERPDAQAPCPLDLADHCDCSDALLGVMVVAVPR